MIVNFIDFLRDHLKIVVRLSYVAMVLLVAWDYFAVDKHHAHTAIEHLPGFWAVFAFLGCIVLIFLARIYGKTNWFWLFKIQTREDYYDD